MAGSVPRAHSAARGRSLVQLGEAGSQLSVLPDGSVAAVEGLIVLMTRSAKEAGLFMSSRDASPISSLLPSMKLHSES